MLQKLKDSWWIFSGILIPVASFGLKFYLQVHDMTTAMKELEQDVVALSATVGTIRSVQVDFDRRLPLLQYQVNTLSAKLNVLIPPDPGPVPEIK